MDNDELESETTTSSPPVYYGPVKSLLWRWHQRQVMARKQGSLPRVLMARQLGHRSPSLNTCGSWRCHASSSVHEARDEEEDEDECLLFDTLIFSRRGAQSSKTSRTMASTSTSSVRRELGLSAEHRFLHSEFPRGIQSCELNGSTATRSAFLMAFSPDSMLVASTHGDHCVYITRISDGKCVRRLKGHPRSPWCLAFHPSMPNLLATGCLGGQVRIWQLADINGNEDNDQGDNQAGDDEPAESGRRRDKGRETHCELWQSQGVIFSLSFHPSLPLLVMATMNEIHLWDWTSSSSAANGIITLRTLEEREKVRYVKFDYLGNTLITGIANHDFGNCNENRESTMTSTTAGGGESRNPETLNDRFDYFSERYERALQRYNQLAESEALRSLGRSNDDNEDNEDTSAATRSNTRRREGDNVSAWDEERRRTREMCLHTQEMLNSLRQRLMQQIQRYRDLDSTPTSLPPSTSSSDRNTATASTVTTATMTRDVSTPFSHSPESGFVEVQRQQPSTGMTTDHPSLREHNYMQRGNDNSDVSVALRVDDWALDLMRTLENATAANNDNDDNDEDNDATSDQRQPSSSASSQPFLRRTRRLFSSSSSGLRDEDIASLRSHIIYVRRVCHDALAELTVGRQRRQMLRLQAILRMVQAEIVQLSDASAIDSSNSNNNYRNLPSGQERTTLFRSRVQRAVSRVLGNNTGTSPSSSLSSLSQRGLRRKKRKSTTTFGKEVKRANTEASPGDNMITSRKTTDNITNMKRTSQGKTTPSDPSSMSNSATNDETTTTLAQQRDEQEGAGELTSSTSHGDTRGELRALSQRLERLLKERRERVVSASTQNLRSLSADFQRSSPPLLPSPPSTSGEHRHRHFFSHSGSGRGRSIPGVLNFTEEDMEKLRLSFNFDNDEEEEAERASRRRMANRRWLLNTADANERASYFMGDDESSETRRPTGYLTSNRRSLYSLRPFDRRVPSRMQQGSSLASHVNEDAWPLWSDRLARERPLTSSLDDSTEQARSLHNRRSNIMALQRSAQLARSQVLPEHSYSQLQQGSERLTGPFRYLSRQRSNRDSDRSQEEPRPLRDIIWRRLQRRSEQLVRLIVELETTATILEERLTDHRTNSQASQQTHPDPPASTSVAQEGSSRGSSQRPMVDRASGSSHSSSMFPMWPRMRSYASVAASSLNNSNNDVDEDLFELEERRQLINSRRNFFSRQDWRRGRHAADSPFYSSEPVRPGRMLGGRIPGLWPPSWWSSSSSSSSSGSVSHRIQAWPFSVTRLPDLSQRSAHMVVREARIYNEASVDVSEDGNILVTLITCGMVIATKVGVFSLRRDTTLGQCYATFTLESSAVSVSLSPTSRHLLVGLTTRNIHLVAPPLDSSTPNVPMAQVYSLVLPWEQSDNRAGNTRGSRLGNSVAVDRGRLVHKQDIPNTLEQQDNPFGIGSLHRTALNCIRWVPQPGQGMMFATSTGHLKFLR